MKLAVVVLAFVAAACADVHELKPVRILKQVHDYNVDGTYKYVFDTENGIQREEVGAVRQVGKDEFAQTMQGTFSYTSPEGVPVVIKYVADETGFHPTGDVLPTPPPVPAAILRAVEYIRSHPQPDELKRKF